MAGLQEPTFPDVIVALLTPFQSNGNLDLGAVRAHVQHLVESGVDGLMIGGTTGEGPLLEDREVIDLVTAAAQAAGTEVSVLAHVGRPSTSATISLAERALAAGSDAVAAVVPYYYALDDDEQLAHFRAVLAAVAGRAPVYAYTIPARTGNDLSAHVVSRLGMEGLTGVKDSSKSIELHYRYLATGLPILMGSDALVFEALAAGAAGCVSAIANVRPDLFVELTRALSEGRAETAQRLQAEIVEIRAELAQKRGLVGLKALLSHEVPGYPLPLRAPLR